MIKVMKLVKLNAKITFIFVNAQALKNDLIEYKCLFSNKNYQKKFGEKLIF